MRYRDRWVTVRLDVTAKAEFIVMCLPVLKIGGHEPRHWAASKSGKSKEMDAPLKPSEGMQPYRYFLKKLF